MLDAILDTQAHLAEEEGGTFFLYYRPLKKPHAHKKPQKSTERQGRQWKQLILHADYEKKWQAYQDISQSMYKFFEDIKNSDRG
jgi:hypothetical protein